MRRFGPQFIGIGTAHAGWHQLVVWLAAHPEIADRIPALHFFDGAAFASHGHAWYEATLGVVDATKVVGECSAGYLYHPEAAARIAEAYPAAKLIVVVRNPLYRALAAYEAARTVNTRYAAMSAYDYLLAHPAVLEQSMYALPLEQYYAYHSPMSLRVVIYEELAESPLTETQALYTFLGVAPTFVPPALKVFVPPEDAPKHPGPITRLKLFVKGWYKRHFVKPLGPVFTPDSALDRLLTPPQREHLVSLLLPATDRLSHMLSRDMAVLWNMRDEA